MYVFLVCFVQLGWLSLQPWCLLSQDCVCICLMISCVCEQWVRSVWCFLHRDCVGLNNADFRSFEEDRGELDSVYESLCMGLCTLAHVCLCVWVRASVCMYTKINTHHRNLYCWSVKCWQAALHVCVFALTHFRQHIEWLCSSLRSAKAHTQYMCAYLHSLTHLKDMFNPRPIRSVCVHTWIL